MNDAYDNPFALAEDLSNRQAELRQKRLEIAVRDSLKKPYVRVLLQELIISTGWYAPMSHENPDNARQVGRRDVALWLRRHIGAIDFGILARMEQEVAVEIPDPRDRSGADDSDDD